MQCAGSKKNFFFRPRSMQGAKKLFFRATQCAGGKKNFFFGPRNMQGAKKPFFQASQCAGVEKNFFPGLGNSVDIKKNFKIQKSITFGTRKTNRTHNALAYERIPCFLRDK